MRLSKRYSNLEPFIEIFTINFIKAIHLVVQSSSSYERSRLFKLVSIVIWIQSREWQLHRSIKTYMRIG